MIEANRAKLISKTMQANGETIAVAESVTSGLMQHLLSGIPEAAKFYQGGITAYNIGQKYKHLKVEPIHAQQYNCVSQKVAEEMAHEVCILFNSNWGIGITGYATPSEEADNQLFCYYAIVHEGKLADSGKINAVQQDPIEIQIYFAHEVIHKWFAALATTSTSG